MIGEQNSTDDPYLLFQKCQAFFENGKITIVSSWFCYIYDL